MRALTRRLSLVCSGLTLALAGVSGASLAAEPDAAAAATTTSVPAEDAALTWDRLVTEVERTHPLMRAAKAGLAELQAQVSRADWAYFPSFKLEGAATLTPKVTGDALSSNTDTGTWGYFFDVKLEMVQPIWTFGKIGSLQRAAEAGVDVGRAQQEVARWELRVRAAQAYMGQLLSDEMSTILVDGKKWIDKATRRMEDQRDEDSADYDQLEHLRLRARVAEFYVLEAENKLLANQASTGLRLLLSRPAERGAVKLAAGGLELIEVEIHPADDYVAIALASEPQLLSARRRAKAEEALADSRQAQILPDLVIVAEAGVRRANQIDDQQSSFANDSFNGQSVGAALALRWNLDVPQRVFREEQARARALRFKHDAEVRADLVELEVRKIHQQLLNQKELVNVFRDAQKAAQGWLTATWDTYDAGFGTFRDVMDALVQFYAKKIGYLQAVFEHNVIVVKLSQAVGMDVQQLRKKPAGITPESSAR